MDAWIVAGIFTVVLGAVWCELLRFASRKFLIVYTLIALFLSNALSGGVAELGTLFKANDEYTRTIDDLIGAIVDAMDKSDAGKVRDTLEVLNDAYYATYQTIPQLDEAISKAIHELDPESERPDRVKC